jgi:hypothetical protein
MYFHSIKTCKVVHKQQMFRYRPFEEYVLFLGQDKDLY